MSVRGGGGEGAELWCRGGGLLQSTGHQLPQPALHPARHHCYHFPHTCTVLCCLTVIQTGYCQAPSLLCAVGIPQSLAHSIGQKSKVQEGCLQLWVLGPHLLLVGGISLHMKSAEVEFLHTMNPVKYHRGQKLDSVLQGLIKEKIWKSSARKKKGCTGDASAQRRESQEQTPCSFKDCSGRQNNVSAGAGGRSRT